MEQTGLSFLCKSKELVKKQRDRVRRKEYSRRLQDTGSIRNVPNARTMPQIWLGEEHIGGYYELESKLKEME